jgi:hypothetical protein
MTWATLPRKAVQWGGGAVIILIIWLGALNIPVASIGPGIEQSWQHALYHLHRQCLQTGRDYVFAYGPLGHFLATVYEPAFSHTGSRGNLPPNCFLPLPRSAQFKVYRVGSASFCLPAP